MFAMFSQEILSGCLGGDIHSSHEKLEDLWAKGYSAGDIVQTFSRVCVCVCVCVCCLCVCVLSLSLSLCLCVWESEREKVSVKETEWWGWGLQGGEES